MTSAASAMISWARRRLTTFDSFCSGSPRRSRSFTSTPSEPPSALTVATSGFASRPVANHATRPTSIGGFSKQNIDSWRPDLIVVYAGINDNIYNTFRWLKDEPSVGFLNALDFRTSVLFQFAKYHIWDKKLRSTPDFSVIRSDEIFRENIEAIIRLAKQRGSAVVLSTFAISYPTDDQDLLRTLKQQEPIMEHFWGTLGATARGVDAHNGVMKDLADKHELPLAGVSQFIPRDEQHFKDMCHLTDAGYEALVSRLTDVIIPALSRTVKQHIDSSFANAEHQS
jgi:lysophospholipase L1-like esterase